MYWPGVVQGMDNFHSPYRASARSAHWSRAPKPVVHQAGCQREGHRGIIGSSPGSGEISRRQSYPPRNKGARRLELHACPHRIASSQPQQAPTIPFNQFHTNSLAVFKTWHSDKPPYCATPLFVQTAFSTRDRSGAVGARHSPGPGDQGQY